MPGRPAIARIAGLLAGAVVALWTADVLVTLGLLDSATGLTPTLMGRATDYLGLLSAEVVAALVALVLGSALALGASLLRKQPWTREIPAALCAAVTGLALVSTMNDASVFIRARHPLGGYLATAAAVVLWLGLRPLASRATGRAGAAGWVPLIVLVPLLAGFGFLVPAYLARGLGTRALQQAILFVVVAILAVLLLRARRDAGRLVLGSIAPLGALVAVVLSCLASAGIGRDEASPAPATAGPPRPHVVLVILDTVRADHLQRYGYDRNTMPALEAWADGGVVARRAISPAGWTTPAHASILSGLTVSRHGVHYSSRPGRFRTRAFGDLDWLPARLAAAGYDCIAVSANDLAVPGEVEGFRRVIAPRRADWYLSTTGALVDHALPRLNPLSAPLRWRMPHADAREIVDVALRALPGGTRPVFLLVNILDAHSPYNPPGQALDLVGAEGTSSFPRNMQHRDLTARWDRLGPGKAEQLRDLYDGELRWVDVHLERLLDGIEGRLDGPTLVIVASDHGEELGEEGRVGHEYGLSQAVVHVPLMLRAPWLEPGAIDEPVSLLGLHGFILAASRGETPAAAVLAGAEPGGVLSERYASAQNAAMLGGAYRRPWVSLVTDDLKVVGPGEHGPQVHALDGAFAASARDEPDPARARALLDAVDAYWKRFRDTRETDQAPEALTPEELERLRSLGYVQ